MMKQAERIPAFLRGWLRRAALGGMLAAALPIAFAMDWPSAEAVMTNNFGGPYVGRPLLGAVFETDGAVRATETGEILFTHTPGNTASPIPSPMGAWIAMDHGDGLISIYSRLEDPPMTPVPEQAGQGRVIASAGQSGWSEKRGFYFAFFDRKERRWINPSMIINPLPDTIAPVIHSVELINAEGRVFNPTQTRNITQGRYTILVHATDTRQSEQEPPLAPYRLLCSVNGLEIGALNFETYSSRDGVLMVTRNGLVPVRQVYARYPAFEVGEIWFTRGQATLEVIAQDIAGNARNLTFRLQID
jgi:hypothetical protein